MKEKRIIINFISIAVLLLSLVFLAINVAAAISHSVNIGSTVTFRAVGKVYATVTVTDSKSSTVIVEKNSESHSTNGTLEISQQDTSSTGNFSFGGNIDLTADDSAFGDVTYSYTISITNNYQNADAATYRYLKLTFTPPAANSCVTVNYDANLGWGHGNGTTYVTISPYTTATIQVVFTTNATTSNSADMSCSFVLENANILEADYVEYWNGTGSSAPAGEGTAQSPYLISNGAELKWLSDNVKNSSGKYYTQTKDIYLNNGEIIDSAGNADTETAWNVWQPIGTSTYSFKGKYDGCGFKIVGVYINAGPVSSPHGLFGTSMYGTIKNVGVENSYISAGGYVGAICGNNFGGTIENCYNLGVVKGTGIYIGGIAGGANDGIIKNCYNAGAIITTAYNSGPVCGGGCTVTNSYYLTGISSSTANGGTAFSVVDGVCVISSAVEVGGYNGTDLTTALNAWVIANSTQDTVYATWTAGNPYPKFE